MSRFRRRLKHRLTLAVMRVIVWSVTPLILALNALFALAIMGGAVYFVQFIKGI